MRRIVLVSDSESFAGAEVYMVTLVEALASQFEFVVLVSGNAADETRRRLADAGASVSSVPGLRRRPSVRGVVSVWWAMRAARPDLVHVNATDQGDCAAALAAIAFQRAPAVATLHLVLPDRARSREAVSRVLLGTVQMVIGVSKSVSAHAAGKGLPAVAVLNGLRPPQDASRRRDEIGATDDALLVGGVGRLDHQKGWDLLARAAAIVHETRPDVQFVVIGEGPERDRLLALPESRHVHFAGYRERGSEFMRCFDIAVVPSRYEGLALVAIEAMFVGTPVVAASVGGLAEVVEDTRLTVQPEDFEALAAKVLRLVGDEDERSRVGRLSIRRAERAFSVERMARETAAVYDRTWLA